MKQKKYKNWRVEIDNDQIAWLYFDREGSNVNTINPEVLDELSHLLTTAEKSTYKGLVIASGKSKGFIAGADIEQFTHFTKPEEALGLIHHGQQVYNQLAALKIPTVAMVKGFCVGGGCELILACRYRVADDSQTTRIGLPEILLGIQPGWGGSVRLPRLIGALQAMDLILSGRTVAAKAAAQMGLVDAAVPERDLARAARHYILKQPKPHEASYFQALTNSAILRPLIAKLLTKKVKQKVSPEHYPAPFAVIENWKNVGVDNVEKALEVEAQSLARLAMTDTAHNLIRVFFLQDQLKGLAKGTDFKARHVHVIGAGTMGGDIAAWCALRGINVTLQDREPKFIAPAIKRATELFQKKLKSPRLLQQALDRLMPDVHGFGIKQADVIIEAIFENLEAKQKLFKEIEANCKPGAVLATNTSSIPLDEINSVMKKPERLIGIHFFNPVAMMQLVEVVQGKVSSEENIKHGIAFVRQIDKLPLPVKSYPGFLVNRVLMPYLMEAMVLLEENIPASVIDKAAVNFGMPMGPVQLVDTVGLDVCLAVAKNLAGHFGGTVPQRLIDMVEKGNLGRKSGKGFYVYKSGRIVKENGATEDIKTTDIADRLILRMINEAVACLREKVIADENLLDAGMVFGTGFAPFRGGPMHYAHHVGLQDIMHQLEQFSQEYGERFTPDKGWATLLQQPKIKTKPKVTTEI